MGRDYRKILREKGIVLPTFSDSPACQLSNAWLRCDARQRRNFCRRFGLVPASQAFRPAQEGPEVREEYRDETTRFEESEMGKCLVELGRESPELGSADNPE